MRTKTIDPAYLPRGAIVIDPQTGTPALVHDVQLVEEKVFILWGAEKKAPGSIGCSIPKGTLVEMVVPEPAEPAPAAIEEEWVDDLP